MAIKGNLHEVGLPDVFQLLAMGQKTGCLAVTDRTNFGYVYFDRGRITYATIVNRRDRLGDLLVKNNLLRPEDLAAAVEEQARQPQRRLGEILVERGLITQEQLEHYIRLQIEEAIYHLFTWTQGTFQFEPDVRPDPHALLVSINPENVLLEGARRIDEWSLIEKKIPSFDLVFALEVGRSLEGLELTEEQRKILPLLDGSRSVREVVDESGLLEFDVAKAIFGLLQAGLVRPAGQKAPPPPRHVPRVRLDEHRNLGVAFYKAGMLEEAQREWRRVAELEPRNAEARFYLALIAMRQGHLRAALRPLREAIDLQGPKASAFHNLALLLEGLGRLDDAELALEEAHRRAPDRPVVQLSRAVLLLKRGRWAEALAAFAALREGPGKRPGALYVFGALADALAGRLDAALAWGREGLERFPDLAPLLLVVGALHERKGEWEEAEALYRRAVAADPARAQAHKALGDALYRRGLYDDAAAAYRAATERDPELGDDVYFKLGNIAYKQGDRTQAVAFWRKALELNPENQVVRTNLELVEAMA